MHGYLEANLPPGVEGIYDLFDAQNLRMYLEQMVQEYPWLLTDSYFRHAKKLVQGGENSPEVSYVICSIGHELYGGHFGMLGLYSKVFHVLFLIEKYRVIDKEGKEYLCFQTQKILQAIRQLYNGGRSSVAKAIESYLERGKWDSCVTVFGIDGDKVRQYPDIDLFCQEAFGTR